MSISTAANAFDVSHIDVKGFAHNNKTQNKIAKWKHRLEKPRVEVLKNANRLQNIERREFGPNVADVYKENDLHRITNIESYLLVACIFAAISSAIGSLYTPIFLIITIVAAWFASIDYRFYRHHLTCYYHLLSLDAQICPHCGKPLRFKRSVTPSLNG